MRTSAVVVFAAIAAPAFALPVTLEARKSSSHAAQNIDHAMNALSSAVDIGTNIYAFVSLWYYALRFFY